MANVPRPGAPFNTTAHVCRLPGRTARELVNGVAEVLEGLVAGFRVRGAGLGVAALVVLQGVGRAGEVALAIIRGERQRLDQRGGRGVDLRQSPLRIFPPAAAGSGGRGTGG